MSGNRLSGHFTLAVERKDDLHCTPWHIPGIIYLLNLNQKFAYQLEKTPTILPLVTRYNGSCSPAKGTTKVTLLRVTS